MVVTTAHFGFLSDFKVQKRHRPDLETLPWAREGILKLWVPTGSYPEAPRQSMLNRTLTVPQPTCHDGFD